MNHRRGSIRALGVVAGLLFVTCVGAADVAAQTGRIVGRVVDARTGAPIRSVQVTVAETSAGSLTDGDGRFVIANVPAGPGAVTARSLGYATLTVDVDVPSSAAAIVTLSLEPAAVELAGITVSAVRSGGSAGAVLSERRSATGLSDGLGSEQIARAPDGDVAAALRRVPGVTVVDGRFVYVRGLGERYASTTLNGSPMASPLPDRKAVPLDVIPADLLESVVTAKSYQPDQPADYAGGLVQIRTRGIPARRTMQLSVSTGYNTSASFQRGPGFGGAGLFGLTGPVGMLPSTIFQNARVSLPDDDGARNGFVSALTRRFGAPMVEHPLNRSVGLTIGDRGTILGRTVGAFATVTSSESFTAPDDAQENFFVAAGDEPRNDFAFDVVGGTHQTSLGGLLTGGVELDPDQKVTFTANYNRLTEDGARLFSGTYSGGDYYETYNTRYVASSIASAQLRGEHGVGHANGASVDWRLTAGRASRREPGTRNVAYRGTEPGEPVYFQPSQSSGSVLAQRLDEDLLGAAVDLTLPLPIGEDDVVSIGISADRRDRDVATRRLLLSPVGDLNGAGTLPPAELFVPGRIGVGPGQLAVEDRSFAADDYIAAQAVLAGYAKIEFEIVSGLRAGGGVRVERSEQNVEVTGFGAEEQGVPATRAADTDLVPALNLTYIPREDVRLRAALSRTLARPQFRELAPFLYADYFGDVPVRGNPFLVRSRIVNADLRGEWYFGPGALLSAGVFHKRFDDPIEPIAIMLGTNPGRTFANTESATVTGAEIEARVPLGPFDLTGNLTLARSAVQGDEVSIYDPQRSDPLVYPVERGDRRPLFGQSPYAVNLAATYTRPESGTSASILFNRFGRRVDTTGGVQLPDIYEEGRSQLDLTLEQMIGAGLTVELSASRLLGGDARFTQTFPNGDTVTTRAFDAGRTFSLSIGWGT